MSPVFSSIRMLQIEKDDTDVVKCCDGLKLLDHAMTATAMRGVRVFVIMLSTS